jgi:hypothetical protein
MSNTRPSPDHAEHVNLLDDILFCLICLLDFESIMNLKLVSTYYQQQINNVFANKVWFWEVYCKYHLQAHQLVGNLNFKELVLDRHFLQQRLPTDLNKCSYIHSEMHFFAKTDYYRFGVYGKEFNLKDLHHLLLKDDAAAVFSQVSRLGKIIPYFMNDYLDMDLPYAIEKLQRVVQRRFILEDLLFIGLLPSIMKIRAVNCFNLFIRAYLHLTATFDCVTEDTTIVKVCQTIFSYTDKFYIKELIHLTIKLCQINNPDIYEVIKYAYEHNHHDVLATCLLQLDPQALQTFLDAGMNEGLISQTMTKCLREEINKRMLPAKVACRQ